MISDWKSAPEAGGEYRTATYCPSCAEKSARFGGVEGPDDPQATCDHCGSPETTRKAYIAIHDFRWKFSPEFLAGNIP